MKLALVCIAKEEDLYIQEWIDYHLKLGFDKIFVYQNNWRWNGESPDVVKTILDGKRRQLDAYNDFLKNQTSFKWAAFLDVDEFLVLKKHKNIKDFLKDYEDYDSIGINWVLFGDNGLEFKKNSETSLIKRFTKRQIKVNQTIKTITEVKSDFVFITPHNLKTNWVDLNYNLKKGASNSEGTDDIAQINHYFCKTKNEFFNKINRGRATTTSKSSIDDFNGHNFNEIEDLNAYNFMYNDNNNILNT